LGTGNGKINLLFFVEGPNEIVLACRENQESAHPEGLNERGGKGEPIEK